MPDNTNSAFSQHCALLKSHIARFSRSIVLQLHACKRDPSIREITWPRFSNSSFLGRVCPACPLFASSRIGRNEERPAIRPLRIRCAYFSCHRVGLWKRLRKYRQHVGQLLIVFLSFHKGHARGLERCRVLHARTSPSKPNGILPAEAGPLHYGFGPRGLLTAPLLRACQ